MAETQIAPDPPAPPPANPGSLGAGIALAWACLIGGYFAVGMVASVIFRIFNGVNSDAGALFAVLLCLFPWIAMVVLIVYFGKHNQPRTALGVGVGIASIIGVVLLLVAACFGLLSNTNFH